MVEPVGGDAVKHHVLAGILGGGNLGGSGNLRIDGQDKVFRQVLLDLDLDIADKLVPQCLPRSTDEGRVHV